ncbi:P-loop containing nucleoside triphosphate hydrolase protein [Tribonema minus]|uniref:P-loop containing nucleoside triphosphate hydrolase protein n=1 Tax=Tribonema minus TaxID=303371 RepID=A0A835ZE29_9STRA|nr:P-loop containing nucleoside triphosphate hydrolase protein [Tribonema minus]
MTEHEKELRALRQAKKDRDADQINTAEDLNKRLNYLMAQSEIFTHFLESTGGGKALDAGAKGKSKGGRTKVSEEAEDRLMMKQAQSAARVTRLVKQPDLITHGTMRDYQLEGLNWMIKLHDNGINGILADEMGLGKTLQSISLLAYLREGRGIHGPHVVIVPKSTVGNWIREFERWCPKINVVKLLGSKDERKAVCETRIAPGKFDVVVTSYECVLKEKATLTKIKWKYLMIDEAHRIKASAPRHTRAAAINEKSSLSRQVRLMSTRFRLLITGTPLQNNLHELWALLNFLLPDVFSSADDFDQWFNVTGDSQQQENVIKKLHTVLRPFMLRRIKADVEKDLPPKKEIKLYVPLVAMQREWYRKVLSKDAHALNALGGPDRARLLNVLMQLRKVCNHPYLFTGAEIGPPYQDGPHMWENSAKLSLLHKLLPRLKGSGSRVLIFSQMTRLLDILEDYLNYNGHAYCRIDGSTDGESRDSQMAEFNAPNSPKFCFLLSTRAGGLGINLQTADTVVLYDSDWNPQADLQAMDRAHRIGQTRPVRVFRFVCEGTVEEKIVERADRKLFLDAAVIQQGRLAEKHAQLSKDELMTMVKFGADDILHTENDKDMTEEDIDALLFRGEEKTQSLKDKIETDMRHNLANFSLMGDGEAPSLFDFEGRDYKKNSGAGGHLLINLPGRERKRAAYDVDAYYRRGGPGAAGGAPRPRRKGLVMQDYQFYDQAKLGAILEREADEDAAELEEQAAAIEEQLPALVLSDKDAADKKRLIADAFPDWTRKDARTFVAALERNGRGDRDQVVREVAIDTGKPDEDIVRYFNVFLKRCHELSDHAKVMEKIERGERRIQRSKEIKVALEKKVQRHQSPWQHLPISYGSTKGKTYTEEEDAFLINMMHRYGYGNWEVIRTQIKKAWQFHFDWFFKSRNAAELQKRGDYLIKVVEKENEEIDAAQRAASSAGGKKRKSAGGAAAAANSASAKAAPARPLTGAAKRSATPLSGAAAKRKKR